MSTMTYNHHAAGSPSTWHRLSGLKASLAERRAQRRAYRSTVSVLSALSSRELTNISTQPVDIHDIARPGAYGT